MVAVLFGVLITRLFNLQVAGYEDNLDSAESKKTKTITSQGSRGTIMDVNSLTLAYDKQIYNVQFYRDPNYTPTDIDETTGKTVSQYKVYTNAIINVIDIVEKNGGTLNTSFSLVQDEMTGLWVFTWNNSIIRRRSRMRAKKCGAATSMSAALPRIRSRNYLKSSAPNTGFLTN